MMNKIIPIFILFPLSITASLSCELQKLNHLLIGDKKKLVSDLQRSFSSCPQKTIQDFTKEVINQEQETFKFNNLVVQTIDHFLTKELFKDNDLIISDIKIIGRLKNFWGKSLSLYQIDCSDCTRPGNKNLKLSLSYDNETTELWLTGIVKEKTTAYQATRSLSPFSSFKSIKNDLKKVTIYATKPEQLVQTIEEIQYYKTNRSIAKGQVIQKRDLSPKKIVQYGSIVKVILKSGTISITSSAKALKAGHIGEIISLKSLSNNKLITAEVIGPDLVEVKI